MAPHRACQQSSIKLFAGCRAGAPAGGIVNRIFAMICDSAPVIFRFGGKPLRLRDSLSMMAGAVPVVAVAATGPAGHRVQNPALTGDVFVERFEPAAGGGRARILERADALHPGDRLVFVVSWTGGNPAGFTVVNPVPRAVVYQAGLGAPEEVSVDGGHTWGALGALMVRDGDAWRHALAGDVTHVRWRVPGASGQITYRGVVR